MLDRIKTALNGICPYFTMFPLAFPFSILKKNAKAGEWVMDPFCGRGTTNYASRLLGLPSIGIDSNPVAVALTQAKLSNTSADSIIKTAKRILDEVESPVNIPTGEFWEWAFHKDVLNTICRLREGLLDNCSSNARKALRAVIMGALHGPCFKRPSYLSNQCTRTYSPKPRYAVKYWKSKGLTPAAVDVLQILETRAKRYYSNEETAAVGRVIRGDSRDSKSYESLTGNVKINWVITSPPYLGMHTYIPDQWLRLWFVGGKSDVDYSSVGQIRHTSPEEFSNQLSQVWGNIGTTCNSGARLIVRIGSLNWNKVDHLDLIKQSLHSFGWRIQTIVSAGSASEGFRQASYFSSHCKTAIVEHDVWATWEG